MGRPFYAYMLRCADGSFYVAHTDDLNVRLEQHRAGLGSRHTRTRLPVQLVWQQNFGTRDDAQSAERQIKRWNRAKKLALVQGDFETISRLGSRSAAGRALRDVLLRRTPQGRG